MYVPGRRTIAKLAFRALSPVVSVAERTGVSEALARVRTTALAFHTERVEALPWVRLQHALSEPSGSFFSENLVSNESGFLSAAPALMALPEGLAYLGVGPEQSLTYLGLARASLGFVVDVRRDNARLHLLYRALFELAESRSEWLALLLGRPHDRPGAPGPDASLDEVLDWAVRRDPSEESFREAHAQILEVLAGFRGLLLPGDRRRLAAIHRWFWQKQLELTFETEGLGLRRYPSLRTLLAARAPDGKRLGFLAAEPVFADVRRLHRESRVVPVVGDFAGSIAMRGIAEELRERRIELGALYVSNVEQYLFEQGKFRRWLGNLAALPTHRDAVMIRSFFAEHGEPAADPPSGLPATVARSLRIAAKRLATPRRQRPVHQMVTVVHRLDRFLERAERYQSFRELVRDPELGRFLPCEHGKR
jgi:hypothetical protein